MIALINVKQAQIASAIGMVLQLAMVIAGHFVPAVAAQFGLGAAVAPLVGVLGNDEFALALVMTVGVVVALFALLIVGVPRVDGEPSEAGGVLADPA